MSDVTYGAKVPEELKAQLEQLQKDSGLRTGKDFLQQLINCYVVEKTKESVPQVAEDLKELQTLTQRINNIYLNLGYRIDNITKAHEEDIQDQLGKKDSIISGLQDKLNTFQSEKEIITTAYNDTINKNNEYLQRVNELTESNNNIKELNEEYKSKVDTMAGLLKQYEAYPEQLETTKALLTDANTKVMQQENIIKENGLNINKLNGDLEALKLDHEKSINELKALHKKELAELSNKNNNDINSMMEKAEIEKEKAILKLQQDNQKELQKLNAEQHIELAKSHAEVASYQTKYRSLLDELEQIRSISKKETSKLK